VISAPEINDGKWFLEMDPGFEWSNPSNGRASTKQIAAPTVGEAMVWIGKYEDRFRSSKGSLQFDNALGCTNGVFMFFPNSTRPAETIWERLIYLAKEGKLELVK